MTRKDLLTALAAVAAGGALGAAARYLISTAWPAPPGSVPWAVLAVNVAGCAAIGVLLVTLEAWFPQRRLVRPFLGTGFLGGFTTFSTFAVDVERLAADGYVALALGYLVLTPVLAVTAALFASAAARALISRRLT